MDNLQKPKIFGVGNSLIKQLTIYYTPCSSGWVNIMKDKAYVIAFELDGSGIYHSESNELSAGEYELIRVVEQNGQYLIMGIGYLNIL